MVTTFYPPYSFGGDGRFVADLSDALVARGHEVDVLHSLDAWRALAPRSSPATVPAPSGVRVHGLSTPAGRLALLAAHQVGRPVLHARGIARYIPRGTFDVVHFHNISLFGPGVLRYGTGVTLYTLHEHWAICEAHTLFRMNQAVCRRPTCVRCALVYRRPPQWWRRTGLLRTSLRYVDCVIAPSRAILETHRAAGIRARFAHVPHFALDPHGPTAPVPALPAAPFFLFAGRLEKLKGAQTLLPLVQRHEALHLVVAGDGRYAGELRRMAAECDRIHFTGQLTREQMRTAYARACAVIVPSLTYEAFGLVVAEAMAAGAPVIARDLGALAELAHEGGAPTYATDDELLGHLRRLLASPAERARISAAGRAAYERAWTRDAHVTTYLDLIEQIRAEKSGPACAS